MKALAEILSASEIEIVRRCLRAAVEGPFFPDWEFGTLFGIDRDTVREVCEAWPQRTVDREEFGCAIIGSMNNLLGYPHGMDDEIVGYVPEGREAIRTVLLRVASEGL